MFAHLLDLLPAGDRVVQRLDFGKGPHRSSARRKRASSSSCAAHLRSTLDLGGQLPAWDGKVRARPTPDVRPRRVCDTTIREAAGHQRAGPERSRHKNRVPVSSRSCGSAFDPEEIRRLNSVSPTQSARHVRGLRRSLGGKGHIGSQPSRLEGRPLSIDLVIVSGQATHLASLRWTLVPASHGG